MGKLLVRKSGKVQLVLGKVTLDVTMGTPCSFLQVQGRVCVGGVSGDLVRGAAPHHSPLGLGGPWGHQGGAGSWHPPASLWLLLSPEVWVAVGGTSPPGLGTPPPAPGSGQGPQALLPATIKAFPVGLGCLRAFLPAGTGAGVRRHRGQPDGGDDRPGPREAQAGVFPGLRGSAGAPAPVARGEPAVGGVLSPMPAARGDAPRAARGPCGALGPSSLGTRRGVFCRCGRRDGSYLLPGPAVGQHRGWGLRL